jgi:hypothetical protein
MSYEYRLRVKYLGKEQSIVVTTRQHTDKLWSASSVGLGDGHAFDVECEAIEGLLKTHNITIIYWE